MKLRRILTTVILAAAIVIVLVLVIWFRVLTLKKINVTGASLYPEETVTEEIKSDAKAWNTAYVYMKYRDGKIEELPYLESVDVSMADPHTINVTVTEKDALGYFYDEDAGQYVAFDAEGMILKISEDEIDTEVRIRGLEIESYELYGQMELSDTSDLDAVESVLVLLESYDFLPDSLLVRTAGTIVLDYGDIQVNLGTTNYLNEKVVRLVKLWDKIKERKGTLHLETWTESTTDIHFRKKELLDLDDPDATYESAAADSDTDTGTESGDETSPDEETYTEDSYSEDSDAEDSDTGDSDTEDSDIEDSDTEDSYTEDSYTGDDAYTYE